MQTGAERVDEHTRGDGRHEGLQLRDGGAGRRDAQGGGVGGVGGSLREDHAVVEGLGVEGLQGHARYRAPGEQGVLQRRRAAEVWQERGVHV